MQNLRCHQVFSHASCKTKKEMLKRRYVYTECGWGVGASSLAEDPHTPVHTLLGPLLISERKHVDVLKITNFIIITTCSCLFTNPHVQRCATHTPFGALSARSITQEIQVHVLVEVSLLFCRGCRTAAGRRGHTLQALVASRTASCQANVTKLKDCKLPGKRHIVQTLVASVPKARKRHTSHMATWASH